MAEQTTKQCPRCAEAIQADAVMCRFCGYVYGTPVVPAPEPVSIRQKTNGLAIASLVLGILWLYGIGSLLALIFGLIARAQIKISGDTQSGGGMALAGAILGGIGLAIVAVGVLVFFSGVETSKVFSCTAQDIADKAALC